LLEIAQALEARDLCGNTPTCAVPKANILRAILMDTPSNEDERHAQAYMRKIHELTELLTAWFAASRATRQQEPDFSCRSWGQKCGKLFTSEKESAAAQYDRASGCSAKFELGPFA
jgi:hypothetical protein